MQNTCATTISGLKTCVKNMVWSTSQSRKNTRQKTCPICGEIHNNSRKHRGLFVCLIKKKAMNADLVGAFNNFVAAKSPCESMGYSRGGGRGG